MPCPVKPLLPIFRHEPGITDRVERERLSVLAYSLAVALAEAAMPTALVILLRGRRGEATDGGVTE
jgi:hypothetical protein